MATRSHWPPSPTPQTRPGSSSISLRRQVSLPYRPACTRCVWKCPIPCRRKGRVGPKPGAHRAPPTSCRSCSLPGSPTWHSNRRPRAAQIRITCAPPITIGQRVLLIVGDRPLSLTSQTGGGATLIFLLPAADPDRLPGGEYVVRLRVDGVDSLAASVADPFTFANKVTLP